ncbi:SDR family NAD(P)-dependent oxidoreductase [Spirosoma foliorum]|uniref:Glucose 1-dehydrogenase n=1 Tax=Spirosoma foliorum TaxID=2710596 RepID=A0A7G5GVB3_9BACT|nr:glucose 1-dehydrogenase [Spirosoma foliorum]QMW02805.1 glucose 1-dehydrogenase [Spirosoma foliorum]
MELKDKVALVTGASKGIGAGIALELAKAGAKLVINYSSNRDDAQTIANRIQNETATEAIIVQADVSQKQQVKTMFQTAIDRFGRIDILVNNAGIYTYPLISDVTEEAYRSLFDVNVLGSLLTIQEAVQYMCESGGSIINISSLATRKTVHGASLYAATKAALNEITKVTAQELGSMKIRVNAILPGYVDTEGARSMGENAAEWAKQLVAATPLGRGGLPSDIGRVAVFLASDTSYWITGELIAASGGLL